MMIMNLRKKIEELEKRLILLEQHIQHDDDIDDRVPPVFKITDPFEDNKTAPPFEWPDIE